MRSIIFGTLGILATVTAALAQTPNFPQTLPPNTLVGRLGLGAGPAQAIPLNTLTNFTTMIPLGVQYGVRCDGVVDNSTAIAQAITDANAAGGGRTLLFPKGTCLAPTLAATITGINTWLMCDGGPGTCILKGSANNMLTWGGSFGGAMNMGFDNAGAAANTTINIGNGVCCTEFHHVFLGTGIGTFVQDAIANTAGIIFDDVFGSVNCTAPVAIWSFTAGAGLAVRNSNVSGGCAFGSAVSGRIVFAIGGSGNFDTLTVQNNAFVNFDAPIIAAASNGQSTTDFFIQGNIWDEMNNGMDFVALAGGLIGNINLDDQWLGVYQNGGTTAGACMLFQGAGQIVGVHITEKMPICAGSGIVGTVTTASFWTIDNATLDGGNANNLGSTIGLSLNGGGGTWSNITVKNSRFSKGINSTHVLNMGCQTNGAMDHFMFSNNDCQGTTNYNGMLTGTAAVFAHTNSKQFGNIGLADSVDQLTFATLPANPQPGSTQVMTDGLAANCGDTTCTTFRTNVTGGTGALKLVVQWNGTNWKLVDW